MAYKPQVGDRVFDMMATAADSTDVSLEKGVEIEKSTESIHTALMAAGFAPGIGNIADITDATLYALEGELGNAAWSAAAAIPIIGQMVSGKRALKAAKEAGEEMVTLYRGSNKWHKGTMVYEGKFLGGAQDALYTTTSKKVAKEYKWGSPEGILLEFEVPKSYIKGHAKLGKIGQPSKEMADMMIFKDGLPKEFLKKVHK